MNVNLDGPITQAEAADFFATARERYAIKEKRNSGAEYPWTTDPVFSAWRFCNVHREDDRTTVWFRENIRNPLSEAARPPDAHVGDWHRLLLGTIIFRWFNRIETAEIIKDLLLGEWNTEEARRRLTGVSPVVTGAYIIKGPDGYSKLDGVLYCVDLADKQLHELLHADCWKTLEQGWNNLKEFYYLAGFMSYEIVSDLRWTPILDRAPDIRTWANAGPGAARGLGWIRTGRNQNERSDQLYNPGSAKDQRAMLEDMRALLEIAPDHWPTAWKPWEMREVEHWLCEYDKYKRGQQGLKLKRRFQP